MTSSQTSAVIAHGDISARSDDVGSSNIQPSDTLPASTKDLALIGRTQPQPEEAVFSLLVCPQFDQTCRNQPYRYFCDKNGHMWYKSQIQLCSSRCRCVFVICDRRVTHCYTNPPKDDLTLQLPGNLSAVVRESLIGHEHHSDPTDSGTTEIGLVQSGIRPAPTADDDTRYGSIAKDDEKTSALERRHNL